MIKILLIGFSVIAINVILQAIASTYWTRKIASSVEKWHDEITTRRAITLLILSFLYLTLLHLIHALIWAVFIGILPATKVDFATSNDLFYYSVVTFTTLGYGDLTISSPWRMLSGFEAINGIMLIGWSTALMYSLIQNIYRSTYKSMHQ
ncbi:potassium channel family protein [Maribellus sediminis]|uniref:potassium channel family protein n=1 Tax=Maribellus sediminis TaxID=2696285 RepID=UPI00142F79B0|nr:potassium channel family protein [Maribellus sediminis]